MHGHVAEGLSATSPAPQLTSDVVSDVIRSVPVALAAVIASGLLTASGMPSEAFAGSWRRE